MRNFISACLILFSCNLSLAQTGSNEPGSPDASASEAGTNQAASTSITLDGLLDAVQQGRVVDNKKNRERLREFLRDRSKQRSMLRQILDEEKNLEAVSQQLEKSFEKNELAIGEMESRMRERMGSLKELFGVLQQVSSDAQAQFSVSLTELEFPQRSEFLVSFAGRMGQANRLPEIAEIEKLWFELQREMIESGRVVTRSHPVLTPEGAEENKQVTRVGLFNAVADGKFLQFIPETGRLLEFPRQPDARFMFGPKAIANGDTEVFPFAIDPVRGQLLSILTQAPNLRERVGQGGVIGYIIIGLGIFGVLLAVYRFISLFFESRKINQQLADLDNPNAKNALGRILLACSNAEKMDVEALELKMSEAVLREVPRITRHLSLLKIIAAVAPLMGLLGTVTGMIITFQAITLFGAGDPRLMAGGISQALITTVLGLTVAIPTLLLHNIVQSRARTVTDILQHEAVAVVASHAESVHGR
ncbi:MAG: MotA/TolQ/ExbB proton channel family protein [Gammaproteobacteria bacterium]|nr:MotA/TolQ/ExbB proton channel family protein [Gammaproteobacteria bacterium]MBT8150783.1 MotA/TolQ/ExbB proton channel family protein [Gammaproteobacteria bacterium]NND39628.1 MotA/TolQ/ExbB proton channel family protein [Pseudomonadales bacterium]NNM11868.1 MotA/TolQ/ExbB proton channel family protein [Pseudomonadales bacterium]RZV50001.1 MAG: MotA/TolQ/ExbB proton channel family protein [Pseudomonadales bacterium]